MRKITLSFTLFTLIAFASFAQDYKTGIGVRAGTSNGLTIKHFISTGSLIEGIFATRRQGYNITGLYEIYRPAFNVNRLNWFYGAGAHIGSYQGGEQGRTDDETDEWLIGIDGIIGLEYNFAEIPFNISLDWKPAIDFTGGFYPWGDEIAFSLRYIFRSKK